MQWDIGDKAENKSQNANPAKRMKLQRTFWGCFPLVPHS